MTEDRKIAVSVMIKAVEVIREMADQGNPDAWQAITGMPPSTLYDMLQWSVEKSIPPDDVLLTVAGIAFAHGKKVGRAEATENVKAASDVVSNEKAAEAQWERF